LTRFRILALFAVLTAIAAVFAACGGSDDGGGGSGGEDPQKVLEGASLEGVKSGEFDLSLHLTSEGKEGGDVEVQIGGPFEAGAKGELPQAEVSAEASGSAGGEDLDFEGGLTVLTDRAFVEYEGTSYEIDPTTFGFVKAALEQSQQQEGKNDVTACQKAAEGIKFSQFAEELVNEGSADVDGTSTTKISGDLNPGGAVDALIQLTEDPACSSQLEAAGPLPIGELEEAKGELSKAIKKAHIDLYVGDDDIVRKVAAELTVQPPEAGDEKVELEMELTLSGVNEEQSFSEPSDAKSLEDFLEDTGIETAEIEKLLEGGIGGFLEGIGGGSSGSSNSGNKYTECLQDARTPADLQKCASLR
jgi:hypothetical protein